MYKREYETTLNGDTIKATFSDLVENANGSVILSCKDTVVLATAVMSEREDKNLGYFNLQVEYMEKYYASGEILGIRFQKREGRSTTKAILSSRVIDRTLRPLFDKRIKNAVQVVVTVLSLGDYDPTMLGLNAASIALSVSDIPFNGPVSGVLLTKDNLLDGEKINQTRKEDYSEADIVVCGAKGKINMIEASTAEISNDEMAEMIGRAQQYIDQLENWQNELVEKEGKAKKVIEFKEVNEKIKTLANEMYEEIYEGIRGNDSRKLISEMQTEFLNRLLSVVGEEEFEEIRGEAEEYYDKLVDDVVHELALKENKRVDGRGLDELREIKSEVGVVGGKTHGSGLFYRGGTHVLSIATLSGPEDMLLEEGMEIKKEKRFYHHYNFAPYSVGEVGRIGFPNRRAVGHGMLAEKAMVPVIPSEEEFPYTIRVVSECMSSNGSTSQASICAMSLALHDAGVPVKKHVAGIAMGVIISEDGKDYRILTDIQGPEDHYGDMDFKVAGTEDGITALQLDIKVDGIDIEVIKEALEKAKNARVKILEVMTNAISKPRPEISPLAPHIKILKIDKAFIGYVIGSGGETIRKIQEDTNTVITIKENGEIYLVGKKDGVEEAHKYIKDMTKVWEVGEKTVGTVKKILEGVGAIVDLPGGKDGMVHISELANYRVDEISKLLKEGEKVPVTIIRVDKDSGRIGLSIKKDNPGFFKKPE